MAGRHISSLRLAAAVGLPVSAVGLVTGARWLHAYGAGGVVAGGLGVVMVLAAMAIWVFSPSLSESGVVFFVSAVTLAVALGGAYTGVDKWVLYSRGVRAQCAVLDVDKRVETHTTTDAQGFSNTTTTTSYDHRLRCAGGRPRDMTTSRRIAGKGERLTVAYDPDGRVGPSPAGDLSDGRAARWVCGIGLAVTIALRVGDVLVHRRRGAGWYQRR
ncbi:hypothetical protein ACH4U6_24570 [Streptomyces netropsis]|uniref:hypothetical protein n=1 Tax=Streptomyces netropsis TaxID=55404 RepID=UPI0037BB0C50